jgi:large subunit ribosomal protein L24
MSRLTNWMMLIGWVEFFQVEISNASFGQKDDPRKTRPYPKSLKIADIRLVYPLPDPETGIPRDVIIEKLKSVPYWDPETGTHRHHRVIPGLNIAIPFFDRYEPDEVDHEDDTLRMTAEEVTWLPTLKSPPMPMGVIDELRNKYSVFRERHEPQYLAEKEKKDKAVEMKKEKALQIQFPMQPMHIFAPNRKKEPPELTEAMLSKIGEIMAKNLGLEDK